MPSTFDETFDYLTLLGLDPARIEVQPSPEVRDLINRRKKEWTAQAINPLYQQQARANLERARQFEQILDSPEALAAYLGYQAAVSTERRERQEAAVGELLALAAGGRSEITAEQHALLLRACEERAIPGDVLAGALRARRLRISEAEPPVAAAGAPYRQPALDRALLAQIAGHLRLLGKESFYELLDLPAGASPAKLISTAQILYDRWSKSLPKTSECVAWEKSLQSCLTYLKDRDSKTRYDHALYNRRLDEFLARIDLVLAAGRFVREDFVLLGKLGVREFGLSAEVVNQCLRWRAGSKGLSLSKPLHVSVTTEGLTRCQRCFRFVGARRTDRCCPHCGSSLDRQCRNPACGRPLAAGAKACGLCGLSVARGVQYSELLRLAEAQVAIGDAGGALESCRLAGQILPSAAVEGLLQRAGKVRTLTASIRRASADRRWARVERELQDLLTLAPHFAQPGCPRADEVSRFLAQLRARLAQATADRDPELEAHECLELLDRWTDSPELLERLHRLARTLEGSGRCEPALAIIRRMAALEPLREEWEVAAVRLERRLAEERDHADRLRRTQEELQAALAGRRLFAAERLLADLEGLGAAERGADVAEDLRDQLAEVRARTDELRRLAEAEGDADELIARHVALLELCRDCRESLTALQALNPAAPLPPEGVLATAQGTRRVVTWQASQTLPDLDYVVERGVQRPGGRGAEPGWTIVREGPGNSFVDAEVLHTGTIVRYSVAARRRGALTVGGGVLREYCVMSAPATAEPLLLWQEALGLRARQRAEEVELTWHTPAGARSVLVERWAGPRDAPPERPDALPTASAGRLVDRLPVGTLLVSYRVRCLYDGPAGDFLTPGSIVTVAPGESLSSAGETPAAEESPLAPAAPSLIETAAADQSAAPRDPNPLKRLGLWPPVPKTG